MNPILVAFFTGLTTGGLSCLAVQGGLLASSLATQLEADMAAMPRGNKKGNATGAISKGEPLPILLFLAAKVVAYTILGFFLGALGSVLQLNAATRAILLIAIGIFMLGNALRILNVHPIFRYFAFEPPAFIKRFIRKKARNGVQLFTPLFLGALTVLIPCGVTQAMMAVAIGTGDPLQGAAIMFAFTLGTSPVFFTVAYLAFSLGSNLEKWFMRLVAVTVLVLGFFSIYSGLTLMGVRVIPAQQVQVAATSPAAQWVNASESGVITINAENSGYSPQVQHAPSGTPLVLNLITENTSSCSRSFVIPSLGIEVLLPGTGTTPVNLPAQPAGSTLNFSCSMGMYSGQIIFD